MLTKEQKEHVKTCREFYVGKDYHNDINLLLVAIHDLEEELRIGNHLCAEQCDKINDLEDEIVEFRMRLKPVQEVYEKWKGKTDLYAMWLEENERKEYLTNSWLAIKQVAESEEKNETEP